MIKPECVFQEVCVYCHKYSAMIPLNFILAFYVAQVVSRWWAQWSVSRTQSSNSLNVRPRPCLGQTSWLSR